MSSLTAVVLAFVLAGPPLAADSLLVAERALADGRPWRATRALAPLLARQETRTPAAVLLAARAAAGWSGWATVRRLLDGTSWIDREAGGAGRALLARAALERGDQDAVAHAALAVSNAPDPRERGRRRVVLARSLDRANLLDSAAATYRRAARDLPTIADWLALRAAGTIGDSTARAALYATITLPSAQNRVRWTEAMARERTGDPAGASVRYASLGATLSAIRLRVVSATTGAERSAARRDLAEALAAAAVSDVRPMVELLDRYRPLTTQEELLVARRGAAAGLLDRSHRAFARAAEAGLLTDDDRFTWGTVFARTGRHREAIAQFERVRGARRAEARYQRARSLFRVGPAQRARAALVAVRDSFPEQPAIAATAGWLYADMLVDDGNDAAARLAFLEIGRRYPATVHGERGAFQAALLAWIAGNHAAAATEFDVIADRSPALSEMTAALYWSGRAWEARGDTARARRRWQSLVDGFPQSYYVVPAARRLGVTPWPTGRSGPRPVAPLSTALARAALLDSLGLRVEARHEYDHIAREAERSADALAATARAFHEAGHAARGLRLAQGAIDRGAPVTGGLLDLLYPMMARDVLLEEAGAESLDHFLVAGLIRQESAFDPSARSSADARGLMQVLPATGAQLARVRGLPEWDPVLLYQPDLNLSLGLRHLREAIRRCAEDITSALAAYNAGPTPVNRWLDRAGIADPEVFIERIPFVETRDYVRRVLYNQARYRAIYG